MKGGKTETIESEPSVPFLKAIRKPCSIDLSGFRPPVEVPPLMGFQLSMCTYAGGEKPCTKGWLGLGVSLPVRCFLLLPISPFGDIDANLIEENEG